MEIYSLYPDDPAGVYWVLAANTSGKGPILLRPEYQDLRCPNCGKVDEEMAVARYLAPDIRVSSKRDARKDVVASADDFVFISHRFAELMKDKGVSGAKLYPLPGDDRFMILIPQRIKADFVCSGLEAKPRSPDGWLGGWDIAATATQKQAACDRLEQLTAVTSPSLLRTLRLLADRAHGNDDALPGRATADHRCLVCGRHFHTYGSIKRGAIKAPIPPNSLFTPSFNHESLRGNRFATLCPEAVGRLLTQRKLTGFRLWSAEKRQQVYP